MKPSNGLPRSLELEILHHYYCTAGDFPRLHAPACIEAVQWLRENNLLQLGCGSDRWKITDRGKAHLLALLTVPLPEQTWHTPWGNIK